MKKILSILFILTQSISFGQILSTSTGEVLTDGNYVLADIVGIAPPSPFQPTDLDSLKVWLSADAGITLNGSNVSVWADQSGNGNNTTQISATSQPLYISSEPFINDMPTVRFDGINDFLNGTTISGINSSDLTLIVVTKGEAQTGVLASILEITDYSSGFSYGRGLYGGGQILWGNGVQLFDYYMPNAGYNYAISGVIKNYGDTTSIFFNDNAPNISINPAITGTFTNGAYRIGNSTGFDYFKGDIAEVILYKQKLNLTNREKIKTYLKTKYNLP